MSFYDDASLVFLPSGQAGKDGKAYSMKPTDGSGDFTFSRGGNLTATRVDSNGLIEKGRENLLKQSNQFDTTWIKAASASLTSGQTGYDGTNNAWLLTKANIYSNIKQSLNQSNVCTFSLYAKANTYSWLLLHIEDSAGDAVVSFNLNDGSIGSQVQNIDASTESVGNGWYRCSITALKNVTEFRIYPNESNGYSGAAGSIYIQDAQLEQGLVATEYIESGASEGLAGILEDSPRFDYSGGASCPALLLEPQRSNLVEYSEYFDGTGWAKNGGITTTINTSAVQSPEGVYNATILTSANATSEQQILANRLSTISGTSYAFSVFAKKKDYDFIHLRFQATGGAFAAGSVYFNISSGSVGHEDSGKTGYIEDYGNGWYRCTAVATATATYSTAACRIQLASSDNQSDVVGDGLKGTYVYGATFEAGSYPTSYIPNHSGGSVTRNAENKYLQNSSILSSGDGTIFWELDEFDTNTSADGFNQIIYVSKNSDSSLNDTIYLDEYIGNFRLYIRKNNILLLRSETGYADLRGSKIAISWNRSGAKIFIDGAENASYVGDASNTFEFFGHDRPYNDAIKSSLKLKQEMYFPTALPDNQCIALTS